MVWPSKKFVAMDARSDRPNIPLGLNGMILGIHGFCFAVIDSRSDRPDIPLGLNGMILGPPLATWVFMGSAYSRSGTPNIPLGLNGMILGCHSKP